MVVDKNLRTDLLVRLEIALPTLYSKAAKIRDTLDMDVDESIYLLALEGGMKLRRYLSGEKVARVRDLQLKYNSVNRPPAQVAANGARRQKTSGQTIIIKMPSGVQIDDPLLPANIKQDALRMAAIYPWFYYLENSIRTFIAIAMERYEGPDWWKGVNPGLIGKVKKRKDNEHKNAWHQKRSGRDIDYLDFSDLMGLISNKARKKLKNDGILPSGDWIDAIIRAVRESRNVIAHMNPLAPESVKSVEVRVKEWNRQVKAKYKDLLDS
jgi:hypothetical protein